ncbi:D-galactonate transporter [Methylobacterium brachiatum]|uniref:D-galactonate transporter n=1 Tax=Methylobacterium brachiatum TaxID=269660 RepID=A0AAJ1TZW5_9HYPH|nr:MFS transporter [Methylobacterium brachiatum]MCB4806428.1 MFS transporter [Methylobacterium brachiatum]MDQ0546677.1 D-galactonate transporter [Methylobacterium brachiatum]
MPTSTVDIYEGHPAIHETQSEVYGKVIRRLIPLLFVCYVLSYLDRINVGFAQLQMKSDLGFNDAVYGLGAGIFFIGYFLFEVPSNLLLERIGARATITRIMVIWGLISASMAFVNGPVLFYCLRFLLGVFEAGLFPGIILYFTHWFPGRYRARIIAIFMSGIAVAGVIGGPISGFIMNSLDDVGGLKGWQWMFILEGLPTTLVGVIVMAYLDDKPEDARWLSAEEKALIRHTLAHERAAAGGGDRHTSWSAFRDKKIYVLAFSYFCFICGVYMISFWLPTLIKEMGVKDSLQIGLLAAIPYSITSVGMIAIGYRSDRTLERRWHCALPAFLGALALIGLTYAGGHAVLSFALLSLASLGIITTMPLFWSIPTAYLKSSSAAGGIALVNSLGLTGGFLSPFILGWIKTGTGSLDLGNWLMAAMMIAGGAVILFAVRPGMLNESRI